MPGRRPDEGSKQTVLEGVFRRFFRREPRQSRSRAAVEAVIQATEDQLRRGRDLDELSVETLSERAGVAMASFYEYFSGKDSLLGILIGRVTRTNFEHLAAELARAPHESLEDMVRSFSGVVVEAYLGHPKRTRALIDGIGRLGLIGVVNAERDRFASLMAARVMPLLPGEEVARVEATMRLVADAIMGVLGFAAHRGGDIDRAAMAREIADLGLYLIRRHHPGASRRSRIR